MEQDELLDSSNYPTTHPRFSTARKAKLGCVKDECGGVEISKAIFLRPKNYILKLDDGSEKKRAKGVQRSVVENEIGLEDYESVVCGDVMECVKDVRRFSSNSHVVHTIKTNKRALCALDDKRAWSSNLSSLPYGHYTLPSKRSRQEPDSWRLVLLFKRV